MTGTFNLKGDGDYAIALSEKEFLFLEKGTTLLGDITSYWNGKVENHQISISTKPRSYLEEIKPLIKADISKGVFYQFMWKVVLIKKDKEHIIYYNEDFPFPTYETLGGKISENRYCDVLFRKVILFVKTNE